MNSNLAEAYMGMDNYKESQKAINSALAFFKFYPDKSYYEEALPTLGRLYLNTGEYMKSAEIYLQSLKNIERNGTALQKGRAYAQVGLAYDYAEVWEKASYYYNTALKYRLEAKDTVGLMNTYNNLGVVAKNQQKYTEAISFYKKSYTLADKYGRETYKINPLINMGVASRMQGNFSAAIQYYNEALKLAEKNKRESQIITATNNLAVLYHSMKRHQDAEPLLKKSVEFAEKKGTLEDKAEYWKNYASGLNALRKDSLSYVALEKGMVYSDSLYKTENARAMTEMSTKYETEKKEQQIKLLNTKTALQQLSIFNQSLALDKQKLALTNKDLEINNKDLRIQRNESEIREKALETKQQKQKIESLKQKTLIQQLQISQRNIYLAVTAGLLLAGACIAYLIYNHRKLAEQARLQSEINKQQEIAARAVLTAEERERRRIATDLHDGVGQLLSAALMNLNGLFKKLSFDDTETQLADRSLALVTESYDEMRSISHQMMPNALLKAGLASAVKEFLDKIDSSQLRINLETAGLNERLDEQTETVLYRVIQETVNNVIKHARASKLDIQLVKDEDGISATIEDNGQGFDSSKIKGKEGIGLKNILSRVEFLKGTVDFDSSPGKGTLVAIHIPA
jgi:signal transduction histidine kinase